MGLSRIGAGLEELAMTLLSISRKARFAQAGVAAVALAAAAFGLHGYGRPPKAVPGVQAFVGIDDSVGVEPHLGQETNLLAALNGHLDPDRDRLTLLRVNFVTTEFFDDPAPESGGQLRDLLAYTFHARPAHHGTRPSLFFDEVARSASWRAGPCVVVLLGDGDQDFASPQEEAALRAAGRALADNPHVKDVVICGISPANRAAWHRRFSALDVSNRLHLMPLDQAALDKISASVAAAGATSGG